MSTYNELQIEGVPIAFLFEPYPQQVDYMKAVIRALNMKHDAVLESPTGTGKTLSLLCSTLAWLRHTQMASILGEQSFINGSKSASAGNGRRIFYCSRTHSQLAQVVSELNRTIYKDVQCAVLGGREQLCTNDLVSRLKDSGAMTAACHSLRKRHGCFPYNKWDKTSVEELNQIYYSNGAPDIEDLVKTARTHSHCAYYRSKQMAENANLILLPYNYLLDPNLRKRHKIDLNNSIIIFDEAHNIVNVSEESASSSITTTQLSQAISEIQKAIGLQQERDELIRAESDLTTAAFGAFVREKAKKEDDSPLNIQTAKMLLESLFNLEEQVERYYVKGMPLSMSYPMFRSQRGPAPKNVQDVKILDGIALVEMLAAAGLSAQSTIILELDQLITKISNLLEQTETRIEKEVGRHLHTISTFILLVLSGTAETIAQDADRMENFKFWINIEKRNETTSKVEEYSLHWGCFDASITMRRLKRLGARSIILTSGTLAPLESFAGEMSLNVGDLFSASHAARAEQVPTTLKLGSQKFR